jgi:hypothetical protein
MAQGVAHIAGAVAHKADLAAAVRREVGPGAAVRKEVVHRVDLVVARTAGLTVVVHTAGPAVVHKAAGAARREVGPGAVDRAARRAAGLEDREAETY